MKSLSSNSPHSCQPLVRCRPLTLGVLICCAALNVQAARPGSQDAACDALDLQFRSSSGSSTERELNFFLFDASARGCLALVDQFLDAGASIKARDRFGNSPLLIAARMGHVDVLDTLLEYGADPHQINLAGSSSLLRAVTMNRRKAVKRLLAVGVDPNKANSRQITPLITSVYNGHQSITKMLLAAGANPSITDASGKGPAVYAAGKGYFAILKRLFETGKIDVNTRYGNDLTVLMWAAGHSNDVPENEGLNTVEYILDAGAELDAIENRHKSALMIAAERGHVLVVEALLKRGADATIVDRDGRDAAALATSEAIRALIAAAGPE